MWRILQTSQWRRAKAHRKKSASIAKQERFSFSEEKVRLAN